MRKPTNGRHEQRMQRASKGSPSRLVSMAAPLWEPPSCEPLVARALVSRQSTAIRLRVVQGVSMMLIRARMHCSSVTVHQLIAFSRTRQREDRLRTAGASQLPSTAGTFRPTR